MSREPLPCPTPRRGPTRLAPRRWRLAALTAAFAVVSAVAAPSAWAHTELESSDPADGGTADRPPASVQLVFADQVRGADPVLTITVAGFEPVDAPAVIDDAIVTADLAAVDIPGLTAASYPVAWEVAYRLVALDGDSFSGHIDFTVTGPPEAAPASTEAPPATSSTSGTSPAAPSSTSASTVSGTAAPTSALTSESSAAAPGTTPSTSEGSAAAPGTTDAPTAGSSSAGAVDAAAGSGGSGWWWAAAVAVVVLVAGGAYWFVRSRRSATSTT